MIESDAWVAKPIGLIFYNIHIVSNQKEYSNMNFPEKLQKLRKERGWSQEELANRITVSRQAVSKWELGVSLR